MSGSLKRAVVIVSLLSVLCILPWPDIGALEAHSHLKSDKTYIGERISLNFRYVDVHEIIKYLSDVSGQTIIIPDSVNGKMTANIQDQPWDQILDSILFPLRLGVKDSGGVMTVYEMPARKVFTPKVLPVVAVKAELDKIRSGNGKITVIGNDIYAEDEPCAIKVMAQIFQRVDRPASEGKHPVSDLSESGRPDEAALPRCNGMEVTYTDEKILLKFRDTDVHDVIKCINKVSGKKIAVPDFARGKITFVRDTPWDQVLDIITTSQNLKVTESGQDMILFESSEYPTLDNVLTYRYRSVVLYRDYQGPQLMTARFTPQHVQVDVVRAELAGIKSERGKIMLIGNDIEVEDEPCVIKVMAQVFQRVDRLNSVGNSGNPANIP